MDSASLILRCRQRAGISQRELATRCRTSAAAISLYETGQRIPRVDTLARIIAATGSTMTTHAEPPPDIDMTTNGGDLVRVLELVNNLPRSSEQELSAPVFAELASR